jgi:HSP20 family protein
MAETVTKLPVKTGTTAMPGFVRSRHPFESLRQEVDRLFDDFDVGFWRAPFRRSMFEMAPFGRFVSKASPAVEIVDKAGEYEITAELPGMDEKDIEVKLSNDGLVISGKKEEAKEEKKKDYVFSERNYGSFERFFVLPDGVDSGKISASFAKGVLTVTLPKIAEAQKQEKEIAINAA